MTKDNEPHDDRFTSPMTVIIGKHAPWVSPYDQMLQRQRTADEFKEEDHPRGQPDNAGQFASTSGSGESSREAPPKQSAERTDLSPKVKALYDKYKKKEEQALEIEHGDFSAKEKELAWTLVNEAYNRVEKAHKDELAKEREAARKPGKVIQRLAAATEDQISEYALMDPIEFREKSGINSIRESGDNKSRLLSAVGKTRAAIMGLPKSHRDKLKGVIVQNQNTIDPSVRAQVETKSDSGYAGMYYPGAKHAEIVDFVSTRDGKHTFAFEDQLGTTVHELGHALDYEFDLELSESGYLQEGIAQDKADLTEARRNAAEYYLSNAREMVAETYKLCFSDSGRAFGMPKSEAWSAFKNTRERLGALLQQKGLDVYAGILAT